MNEKVVETESIPTHLLPSHLTNTGTAVIKKKPGRPSKRCGKKLTPSIVKLFEKLKTIDGYTDLIKSDQVTINEVCEKLGARSTVAKAVKSVRDEGYDQWINQQT